MPPVVMWLVGAVGAVAFAKLLASEARRINSELDRMKSKAEAEAEAERQSLRRDPQSGVYRPH